VGIVDKDTGPSRGVGDVEGAVADDGPDVATFGLVVALPQWKVTIRWYPLLVSLNSRALFALLADLITGQILSEEITHILRIILACEAFIERYGMCCVSSYVWPSIHACH